MIKKIIFDKKNEKKVFKYLKQLNSQGKGPELKVRSIIEKVKKNGDKALKELTYKLDGVNVRSFRVSKEEIKNSYSKIDKKIMPRLKKAAGNIKKFHMMQKKNIKGYIYNNTGYRVKQQYIPIDSAGLYIPGGQAPLFSTVLMAGIPALIAGVKKIVIVSPPRYNKDVNPYILAAADVIGIREIYRVGGSQAIAALAYGTETIPAVDKVAGPGNIYSTTAKKLLFGDIGVDSINGPSEVTIVADKSANPDYIVYDLLAQAEHVNGHSVFITPSVSLERKVEEGLKNKGRKMKINIAMIRVKNTDDAVKIVNYKGPEHLSLMTEKNNTLIKKISNAPAIFSGNNTPVAFGDYMAGPNHILPTNGTCRFFSGLSVLDFLKHRHVIECGRKAMEKFGPAAEYLAAAETLKNHELSIKARRK